MKYYYTIAKRMYDSSSEETQCITGTFLCGIIPGILLFILLTNMMSNLPVIIGLILDLLLGIAGGILMGGVIYFILLVIKTCISELKHHYKLEKEKYDEELKNNYPKEREQSL